MVHINHAKKIILEVTLKFPVSTNIPFAKNIKFSFVLLISVHILRQTEEKKHLSKILPFCCLCLFGAKTRIQFRIL